MNDLFKRTLQTVLARAADARLASPRTIGFNGRRLGRRAGNALEFSEYREYRPGDDLRRLDWNVFGRRELLMVKEFSEEVDPRCDLLLDHSRSMAVTPEKSAAAFGLAALLARAALNAGFSLALHHAADVWRKEPQPEAPSEWLSPEFDAPANPGDGLARYAGMLQRRGLRILISDLLWPEDPQSFLGGFSAGAKQTVLIQILADGELEPVPNGYVMLEDAETGEVRELPIDDAMRQRFRERAARHQEAWRRAAAEHGALLLSFQAGELVPDWSVARLFQTGVLQ